MLKDQKLLEIYSRGSNIAQFISFSPSKDLRYHKLKKEIAIRKDSIEEAISILFDLSTEKSLNIRTFLEDKMSGNPFVYGLKNIEEVCEKVNEFTNQGYYVIVNETIDTHDRGVSGVYHGNVIEFSPNSTPRCVETDTTCRLPWKLGIELLRVIYNTSPKMYSGYKNSDRVEFSVHPRKVGVREENYLIWEYTEMEKGLEEPEYINLNNDFSRFIGNKTFGLILSYLSGFQVPFTTVVGKNLEVFSFGNKNKNYESIILRTSPTEKTPGYYYSGPFTNPFDLMKEENNVVSLLYQEQIPAQYSGGAIVSDNAQNILVEGIRGNGADFMLGISKKETIPVEIENFVKTKLQSLFFSMPYLGDFSVEWVYDNSRLWIVQLTQIENASGLKDVIYPGHPNTWIDFDPILGLEELRKVIKNIKKDNKEVGIYILGDIGVTSHLGDLLRVNKIPSIIKKGYYEK